MGIRIGAVTGTPYKPGDPVYSADVIIFINGTGKRVARFKTESDLTDQDRAQPMKIEIRESTITKLVDAALDARGDRSDKAMRDALRAQFKAILYVPRKLHETKDFKRALD